MAPRSREVQEQLSELQNTGAPINEQLAVAAEFINASPGVLSLFWVEELGKSQQPVSGYFHAREEWVLRWLLRKWQAPDGRAARLSAYAWNLFRHIAEVMPLVSFANILNDRKFISILRQTLLDAKALVAEIEENRDVKITAASTTSKKRKHDGELVRINHPMEIFYPCLAVLESLLYLSAKSKYDVGDSSEGLEDYVQYYVNAALRTSVEDAAVILGTWLNLTRSCLERQLLHPQSWLTPFIQIWNSHITGPTDTFLFSMHCAPEILGLMLWIKKSEPDYVDNEDVMLIYKILRLQLEQLLAQKLLLPSKVAFSSGATSSFKGIVTGLDLPKNPEFAPILFDVAVRSLQHRTHQRRPQDEANWLQEVFSTIEETFSSGKAESNDALVQLLDTAVQHSVNLELSLLQSVTAKQMESENLSWQLVASILKLDPNVFLISNDSLNLLSKLFDQLLKMTAKTGSEVDIEEVVQTVLVPLMTEFANARDLTGFLRHWHTQLTKTVELDSASESLSVWEDEALQQKLPSLVMETLTTIQLHAIIDWIDRDMSTSAGSYFVILDSIAGSLATEETVDTIGPRLIRLALDHHKLKSRNRLRYGWRRWRVLAKVIEASESTSIDRFKESILRQASDYFAKRDRSLSSLESLEAFKVICAMSDLYPNDHASDLAENVERLDTYLANSEVSLTQSGHPSQVIPDENWLVGEYIKYILIHPNLLSIAPTTDLLKNIWNIVSSAANSSESRNEVAEGWLKMLEDELVVNDASLTARIIATITQYAAARDDSFDCNFTAEALARLPLDVYSKSHREMTLRVWTDKLITGKADTAMDAVLNLLVKVMRRPMLYENMSYDTLVQVAKRIHHVKETAITLELFTEFSGLILSHVAAVANQAEQARQFLVETHATTLKQLNVGRVSSSSSRLKLQQVALSTLKKASTSSYNWDDLEEIVRLFKVGLMAELKSMVKKLAKATGGKSGVNPVRVKCLIELVKTLGVNAKMFQSTIEVWPDVKRGTLALLEPEVFEPFNSLFMHLQGDEAFKKVDQVYISTIAARVHLKDNVLTTTKEMDTAGKLDLISRVLSSDSSDLSLTLLLAHLVETVEDSQDPTLCQLYAELCRRLVFARRTRNFCLTAEVLEMMIRTHPRSLTQWNVDTTLSAIARICSKDGPPLNPRRAGAIFVRLCRIMNALLVNHYLKLQGRFHLVVQTMQALLRCLFTPLPYSTRALKMYPSPHWLESDTRLGPSHASAYARLVTLICDPTVSSVTRSYSNNLTSATEKAKRTAGLHMPFVLSFYIRLQLEMDMKPDVREKLTPAIYSIFDTTTIESRKVLGDTLDASGRAVLSNLTRDYLKLGKWKGN